MCKIILNKNKKIHMSEESFDSEAFSNESEEDDRETKNQSDKERGKNEKDDDEDDECTLTTKKLIKSISNALTTILENNKSLGNYTEIIRKQSKSVFSAIDIPKISIKDYLTRIQIYTKMETSTLIMSLIQIDHICKKTNLILTYYNIHRLLFAAVLISIKYNEDSYYDNKYYSEIAGVKVKELQIIEYTFMALNNFNVFIDHREFEQYKNYLEN